jgi:hypothetical protein
MIQNIKDTLLETEVELTQVIKDAEELCRIALDKYRNSVAPHVDNDYKYYVTGMENIFHMKKSLKKVRKAIKNLGDVQ